MLLPGPHGCDLIWNRVSAGVVKADGGRSGGALTARMSLSEGGSRRFDIEETACTGRGHMKRTRGWKDVATGPGTPGAPGAAGSRRTVLELLRHLAQTWETINFH